MIIPEQMKAARGLLNWSQTQLSQATSLSLTTIKRIEASRRRVSGRAENILRIEKALLEAGIIFIPSDENGGPGVRLKEEPERE